MEKCKKYKMIVSIIGSSIACKSAAETLLKGLKGQDMLIIISRDLDLFYSRVLLPNYIAGELTREELIFAGKEIIDHDRLRFLKGEVSSIDARGKKILLEDNSVVCYDKIIITTGASPNKLEVRNSELAGIFYLRDLEDAESIKQKAKTVHRCLVIGGGLVSLKAAWALQELGKEVTVLVGSGRLLSMVADQTVSDMVQEHSQVKGIRIVFNAGVEGFLGDARGVTGVLLQDGSVVEGSLVVVGKGVRPNLDIVKGTNIEIDKGILVNACMETTARDIYAAGDVVQSFDLLNTGTRLFTLWPDAASQGRVAAANVLGITKKYNGGLSMNSVVFGDKAFIFMGMVREKDLTDCKEFSLYNPQKGVYRKVALRGNRLVGSVLGGDISYAGMIYWDIRSGRAVERPEEYLTLEGLTKLYISKTLSKS